MWWLVSAWGAPADLAIRGAPVWTQDPAVPSAEAVAEIGGTIVYVGSAAGLAEWIGPDTEVIEADGGVVLPGFVDAHVHPAEGGDELGQCLLGEATDGDQVIAAVRACDAARPGSSWLIGAGWQLTAFPGGTPPAGVLDHAVPGRPVFLLAADGHSAWVNARALALAGVDARAPDPPGGRLERDADGIPTGVLRESAVDLVADRLPPLARRQWEAGVVRALELAGSRGITTLYEANAWDRAMLRAYRALDRDGALTARIVIALSVEPDTDVADLVRLRSRFDGDRARIVGGKIFVDGVIEARTAAMLAWYADRDDGGAPLWSAEQLEATVAALSAAGFDVHFHAIGDRAVRMALNSVAGAGSDVRYGIAHLEVVAPKDIERFAELGVAAVFQPLWAWADPYIRDLTWPGLGPERSAGLYPIGELGREGALLAFGSDWSVTDIDPLDAIEVAVTRRDPDGDGTDDPLCPDQAIAVEDAVRAYTAGAAWATHQDDVGVLKVGAAADWVLLSADPRAVAPGDIGDIEVRVTVADGAVVYRAP